MTIWRGKSPLVLASQSRARKMLLAGAGLSFETMPAAIDERGVQQASKVSKPGEVASLLAREKANPITLSGGEQQRLCIARAVVNRPSILLADEPTANLDSVSAAEVMEMFRSFNQVGVTVLIATHDDAAVQRLNPRVLALKQGTLAT